MGDGFNLKLPLFLADVRLDDLVFGLFSPEFTSHVCHDLPATEVQVLINVIIAVLRVDLIGQICITFHIIAAILSFLISLSTIVANNMLFVLELARQTKFRKLEQNECDALSIPSLQFVGTNLELDAQILQLNDNVLARRHRVVILVPAADLVLVD